MRRSTAIAQTWGAAVLRSYIVEAAARRSGRRSDFVPGRESAEISLDM